MSFQSRPIRPRRRFADANDTDVREELRSIYRDDDGRMQDMSRFEHRRRRRTNSILLLVVLLFAFAAGVAAAGFFFFRSGERFTGEGVVVKVTAPEQITSGDEIRYTLRYSNNEPVVLGNVEMTVRYPHGFTFKEAHPAPTNQSGASGGTWVLGTIPRGRDGTLEIVGTLVGALNSQANLQALFTYKPSSFNAEFQEIASATTTIANSVVTVAIEGPERVLPESDAIYTVAYENTSETPLQDIAIRVKLPDDFTVSGTKPERTGVATEWSIAKIEKKKKSTIEIRGKYGKEASGERTVTAVIGFGKGDAFVLQKEDVATTAIVKGDLFVSLAMNGSTAGSPVHFGDLLHYTIAVKNNAETPMENLSVRLLIASPVVDWTTLDDKARGLRDGSTITWSKSQMRDLRLLDPGEEVTIVVDVHVKRGKEGLNLEDLVVESRAEVTVDKAKDIPTPFVVNSNTIVQKINSDVALENDARYFAEDGTKIGDGPLPPRAGQTTTYRVRWVVTNTLHELLNSKASVVLPLDVSFGSVGRVSHGTLLYNPDTREVSWTLQRMPTTTTKVTMEFSVVVTPTKEAVGKILPLTGEVTFTARDKVTGGLLTLKKSGLNTALDDDEFGRGKGIVGE